MDAYDEEVVGQDKKGNDDVRTVLRLHPALAPFKCAVLPLSKKEVLIRPRPAAAGRAGRRTSWWTTTTPAPSASATAARTRSGTPFCITLDFQTVGDDTTPADHCVTVRERDSMEQVRIPMDQVKNYIAERIKF